MSTTLKKFLGITDDLGSRVVQRALYTDKAETLPCIFDHDISGRTITAQYRSFLLDRVAVFADTTAVAESLRGRLNLTNSRLKGFFDNSTTLSSADAGVFATTSIKAVENGLDAGTVNAVRFTIPGNRYAGPLQMDFRESPVITLVRLKVADGTGPTDQSDEILFAVREILIPGGPIGNPEDSTAPAYTPFMEASDE